MRHGYLEAFNLWFTYKKCKFQDTSNTDVLWIDCEGQRLFSGIHDSDARLMLYEGHIEAIRFLEKQVPMSMIHKWFERMDLYRLVKTHKFKSIEYLIKIGADIEFWFASTGRQGRRDDRGRRLWSYNNNPQVVTNLLERYGEKLGLASQEKARHATSTKYTQAKYTWGAVTSCVRACFVPNGCHPIPNHDERMFSLREKARRLLTHPFVSKVLEKFDPDDDDHRILKFLHMNVFPKHIDGCEPSQQFYYRLVAEPILDKKMAQLMWNATIQSIALNTNREENLKLLTTTFVTKLLSQVDISPMHLRILQERGFKIAPKCLC
jgi:hypothetical protein